MLFICYGHVSMFGGISVPLLERCTRPDINPTCPIGYVNVSVKSQNKKGMPFMKHVHNGWVITNTPT